MKASDWHYHTKTSVESETERTIMNECASQCRTHSNDFMYIPTYDQVTVQLILNDESAGAK